MLFLAACSKEDIDGEKYYWQIYYEKADFEKFKTPASENGLENTLISVHGELSEIIETGDHYTLIVSDSDKNNWAFSTQENTENILELGDKISVYSIYLGQSSTFDDYPGGLITRYVKEGIIINALTENAAVLYCAVEGYPNEYITDITEQFEDGIIYFNIYLDSSFQWDNLDYVEQSDFAKECVLYSEDMATAIGLGFTKVNTFAFKSDGNNAFSSNGSSVIRIYIDGKYDCDYNIIR